jgi:hypothetical protein
MRNAAKFGIVMMSTEVLEQVGEKARNLQPEVLARDPPEDLTLRRLMEILLGEKQSAFRSGSLFMDSVGVTLASYLLRHYSVASPIAELPADWRRPFCGGASN